jgi:hypothetical protein
LPPAPAALPPAPAALPPAPAAFLSPGPPLPDAHEAATRNEISASGYRIFTTMTAQYAATCAPPEVAAFRTDGDDDPLAEGQVRTPMSRTLGATPRGAAPYVSLMRLRNSAVMGVFLLTLAAAGCAATVSADAYGPDLVTVSPGVQVIADYDVPIFYTDGLYWRYDAGIWYSSPRYTGGWVHATPPVAVLRVDRPGAYVHYRPAGWAGRGGGWRGNPPPAGGGWRGNPPPPAGGGWRGNPPPPAAGGWRGNQGRAAPAHPGPVVRPQPAPPAPARAAPQRPRGNGWRR